MKKGESKEITLEELDKKLDKLEKQGYIQEADSTTKLKKLIIILSICLVLSGIIVYFTITNFPVIQNGFNSTTNSILKIINVDEDKDLNSSLAMYISIKGVRINLLDEETELKATLEQECNGEKTSLEQSVRVQEETECDGEKTSLNTQIDSLESQKSSLESDLSDCEDELESYSGGAV